MKRRVIKLLQNMNTSKVHTMSKKTDRQYFNSNSDRICNKSILTKHVPLCMLTIYELQG